MSRLFCNFVQLSKTLFVNIEMNRLIFLFAFLSVSLITKAQTFYEVSYIDDGTEYLGLMIYYSDEKCVMRLINAESIEENSVYESEYVNYIAEKEDERDIGMMAYLPTEKKFPTFVWYWEKDDASDISERPYVTYKIKKTDSYFESEYFKEIGLEDMDENYVAQFYGKEEPEFQMLVSGINIVKTQSGVQSAFSTRPADIEVTVDDPIVSSNVVLSEDDAEEGANIEPGSGGNTLNMSATSDMQKVDSKFHLIVVANTNVSDIGLACKRDVANLCGEFDGISRVLGMEYDVQVISDRNFNKENLVNLISGFSPASNDVVLFVYTGHGFRFNNQQDYYPNMDLCPSQYDDPKDNYVAVSDVFKQIVAKGARLNIVMSDCCNSKIGATIPLINSNTLFSRSNTNFDKEKLKQLFLESSGTIIATASSPGEASWCGVNGGFFTLSFLESLRNQISVLTTTKPNWETLMNDAIAAAAKKSAENSNCKTQNGMKMVRIKN